MRRSRVGAKKVAMASASWLVKRRQRSSCTSSPENHGEGDGGFKLQETLAVRDEMDMKDLDFSARNKRRRNDMSPQVYDGTEEGLESAGTGRCWDEEFDAEHGEVAPILVAKSPPEILNPNQGSLRSRRSPICKMSTSVIGTQVPRKARSAFVKRLHHEYSASGDNNHQAASEITKKTASSDDQIGKAAVLPGSVDQDIELEVAEVLYGLMRQCQHPDTARQSQQKPHVSNVKELESIKGDGEICTRKNKTNQAEESGGSELKLAQMYEDGLVTEGNSIKEDGKKDKSFSPKGYGLAFESRISGVSEAIPMAPLAEYQAGKLEIDFMVSPNHTAKGVSNLVEGSRWSPIDFDMMMNKTKKEMKEATLEKQEKFTTDMRLLNVAVHDTSPPVEQSHCGLEVTKTAHITSASFPMSKDLCMTDSSTGQMQPRETVAFIDNRSGHSMKGQSRKVSPNGQKRCATHYYIARNIMYGQQCNRMSFPSSASGSSCSNVSGVSFMKKDVIIGESQGVILKGNNITSGTPNIEDSNCPRDKETANEASCLPDSTQRNKHLNNAPQSSPSDKKVNAAALSFPANQYQMVGLDLERSGTSTSASSKKKASLSKNATFAGGPTTGSTFLMTDPAMSFYSPHQAISEAQHHFMTIMPSNGYPFPISAPVGNSGSFKGGGHGHGIPYYGGSVYSPQMFYPPQLLSQQPHSKPPILPSVQSTNRSSHSSSTHKQQHIQQQYGPSVGCHSLLRPSDVHSNIPHKQLVQSSHQTCNPGVEIANKKPLVVDNRISTGERIAYNQQGQHQPLHQMSFTMLPMVAGNDNTRKFEQQESNKGTKVGIELPTPQAFSMSYSPFGGSNVASGMNFSFPPQNPPTFASIPDVAHRTHLAPQTADVVSHKKYQTGRTSGIDFTGAVSDRKGTTGKLTSWVSQAPALSKSDSYDQTGMMKGRSIFDSTAKTLSFNTSSENTNYQNRHHLQLLQQHAQGIWNKTPATNGQPSPGLATNMSHSPVLMSHPAPWNSSVRSPVPQTTSTRPTLAMNPPPQVMSLPCPTQFTFGGSNAKSLAAQGKGMSGMQSPSTLATSCQSPSPKSPDSSSRRNKPGSIASSTPQLNETCSSSPSERISPSPVCRRNAPSILSNCPSQVSEIKH